MGPDIAADSPDGHGPVQTHCWQAEAAAPASGRHSVTGLTGDSVKDTPSLMKANVSIAVEAHWIDGVNGAFSLKRQTSVLQWRVQLGIECLTASLQNSGRQSSSTNIARSFLRLFGHFRM